MHQLHPNAAGEWASLKLKNVTKATLCYGVRAQNVDEIGIFGCDTFMTWVYITLNISKTMNNTFQRPYFIAQVNYIFRRAL